MAKTIEVFKTDIGDRQQADDLKAMLMAQFPGTRINFDLDDCDKILRVEGTDLEPGKISWLVKEKGVSCDLLPD